MINSLFATQMPNQLVLVLGEHAANTWMLELAAWLSIQDHVRVLDGGNRFNVYPVARAIRRQNQDPRAGLQRIRLSRAFTCYQVDALLSEWQPAISPLLVFDLLATFYDESVPLHESRRLLLRVLNRLELHSKLAPVLVSTRMPATICEERVVLFEILKTRVGSLRLELELQAEEHLPIIRQLSLLPGEVG